MAGLTLVGTDRSVNGYACVRCSVFLSQGEALADWTYGQPCHVHVVVLFPCATGGMVHGTVQRTVVKY